MKTIIRCVAIMLLGSAWFAAEAAPQPPPGVAAPTERNLVVKNEADYAITLRDPFSPIGYRLPISELQAAPVEASLVVSNVPSPNIDLKAKARAFLRVRGILKLGNAYVANINGVIVRAGDEVNVTLDGQTMVFVIRAISLKQVQIEPRE